MTVTFWFDPSCPFTWRTSRWLRAEADRRGEAVRWRLMSLSVLNADKDDEEHETHALGRLAARVVAAADAGHGNDAVDALYTALGRRVHERPGRLDRDTVAAAVAEAGLPGALLQAYEDEEHDEPFRASHEEAQRRVGQEAGSPVVAFGDGPAYFGPIVTSRPAGDGARRLYDAVELLSSVPEFSELKRAR